MDFLKEIKEKNAQRKLNIIKSFIDTNLIEKAKSVGQIHPNGKYVWTEYKPGKFDWRSIPKDKQKDTVSSTARDFPTGVIVMTEDGKGKVIGPSTKYPGRVLVELDNGDKKDYYNGKIRKMTLKEVQDKKDDIDPKHLELADEMLAHLNFAEQAAKDIGRDVSEVTAEDVAQEYSPKRLANLKKKYYGESDGGDSSDSKKDGFKNKGWR